MAEQNFQDNTIYALDNLDVLRGMNSETVDLIATDPPFNTRQNRSGTAGHYVDSWKWGDTGKLPDQWAWNEVHPIWLEEIRDDNPALFEAIETAAHCHGQDIAAFLCFLSVRLLEMHRILKPTGSIYLHCDHAANAYIRLALDAIFGSTNFRNEIVWRRYGSHKRRQQKIWESPRHNTLLLQVKRLQLDRRYERKIQQRVPGPGLQEYRHAGKLHHSTPSRKRTLPGEDTNSPGETSLTPGDSPEKNWMKWTPTEKYTGLPRGQSPEGRSASTSPKACQQQT